MKNFLLLTVTLVAMGWNSRNPLPQDDLKLYSLTKIEAETILGQTASLTDSMSSNKNNVAVFQCTYKADDNDPDTGKSGAIYFMIEHYKNPVAAKEKYESFKTSNQNSPGFKILTDIGDEGWFHTDDENFCLIIARKDDKMIRLKVNKLTSKTSIKDFHEVARKITGRL